MQTRQTIAETRKEVAGVLKEISAELVAYCEHEATSELAKSCEPILSSDGVSLLFKPTRMAHVLTGFDMQLNGEFVSGVVTRLVESRAVAFTQCIALA